jgi:aryl-alcohol dehydrogenase-like predicted oxidoreductase
MFLDELKYASPEGTARYRDRLRPRSVDGHFRLQQGLWMSSIGIGTYLGGADEASDRAYSSAIAHAVKLGANVIDTAINYRFQRSERAVGKALHELFSSGQSSRDELIIATKGGFIPFESHAPQSQEDMQSYFEENFIQPGILFREDIVAGCHSLKPRYLQNQLDRSLQNLGIDSIDIYYLHNPETQLSEVPRQEFYKRLLNAFEMLEKNVAAGKIRMYGTATWNAYRVASTEPDYVSLSDMVQLAKTVGGDTHHFKVIQLPFNLAMPEAFGFWNQRSKETQASSLKFAEDFGITVMASASILQAQLAKNLPPQIVEVLDGGLDSDAQRAIQFTRSTPGISVALVGMSQISHVEENLRLAGVPPLPFEKYRRLFKDSGAVG